jgi:hypothetical protein
MMTHDEKVEALARELCSHMGNVSGLDMHGLARHVLARIEKAEAERDALAGQVAALRGALDAMNKSCDKHRCGLLIAEQALADTTAAAEAHDARVGKSAYLDGLEKGWNEGHDMGRQDERQGKSGFAVSTRNPYIGTLPGEGT